MSLPAVDAELGLHVFLINASFAGAAGRGKVLTIYVLTPGHALVLPVFAYRHEVTSDAAKEV